MLIGRTMDLWICSSACLYDSRLQKIPLLFMLPMGGIRILAMTNTMLFIGCPFYMKR